VCQHRSIRSWANGPLSRRCPHETHGSPGHLSSASCTKKPIFVRVDPGKTERNLTTRLDGKAGPERFRPKNDPRAGPSPPPLTPPGRRLGRGISSDRGCRWGAPFFHRVPTHGPTRGVVLVRVGQLSSSSSLTRTFHHAKPTTQNTLRGVGLVRENHLLRKRTVIKSRSTHQPCFPGTQVDAPLPRPPRRKGLCFGEAGSSLSSRSIRSTSWSNA